MVLIFNKMTLSPLESSLFFCENLKLLSSGDNVILLKNGTMQSFEVALNTIRDPCGIFYFKCSRPLTVIVTCTCHHPAMTRSE